MVQNDMIQRENAQLNDDKNMPKMSKIQCYQGEEYFSFLHWSKYRYEQGVKSYEH